ncbi:MAG TPA: OsmC family protein [Polyangiales bacterium]|nr:OsmC family protein [Polyangiales bacterium]
MTPEQLRDFYQRQTRALRRRPDLAQRSGQARARAGGLALECEVEHEDRTQQVAAAIDEGGTGAAPHPGQLLRASIAADLALGYRTWSARLSIPVHEVEVEITCALDARGQLGLEPAVAVGWQRVAIETCLHSDAPTADLQRLVETVQRSSPMLANLSPAIERAHHLRIVRSQVLEGTPRSV